MNLKPFLLTAQDASAAVVAVGLLIETPGARDEVLTCRRDPRTGHSMLAVSSSVDQAITRFNALTPVDLTWSDQDPALPPQSRPCTARIHLGRA